MFSLSSCCFRQMVLFIIFLVLFSFCALKADASRLISSFHDEDGDVEFWVDDDGHTWVWWIGKDGHILGIELDRDTGIDEREISSMDKETLKERIRRARLTHRHKIVRANNPISGMRNAHGQGLAPRWNPVAGRNAPGSNVENHVNPQNIKRKISKGGKKKNVTGVNGVPKVSSKPNPGGMGTRYDHVKPEVVNPILLNHK